MRVVRIDPVFAQRIKSRRYLVAQPVAFTTIPIPFLLRPFALPAQAFILALMI